MHFFYVLKAIGYDYAFGLCQSCWFRKRIESSLSLSCTCLGKEVMLPMTRTPVILDIEKICFFLIGSSVMTSEKEIGGSLKIESISMMDIKEVKAEERPNIQTLLETFLAKSSYSAIPRCLS